MLIFFKDVYLPVIENNISHQIKELIYYALQIGFWMSGAHLLIVLSKIFFWDGIFAKTIKGTVPRLLTHFFSLIVYVLAVMIIAGQVFKLELTGIWATSSVMALILGFALRNMILDLFTGLAVNIEMPYKIGNWIEVSINNSKPDISGQVIDINWRSTRLRDEERKIIIIPNSLISSYIISNYTQPDKPIRFETVIRLDNSIPVEKAKRIIQAAAKEALNNDGFFKEPEPSTIVNETNEFGVEYKVRY
ncbi:MAG: mechanosensitive ion channel family protein [Thermodesulfobacteriota bacterium]